MGNLTNIAVPKVDEDTFCTTGVGVIGVASGGQKFSGSCAIGTSFYCAPFDSDHLLVFDSASNQVSGVDVTGVAQGEKKFSGICAIGTKVYAAPYKTKQLLVYDTVSKQVSGVDVTRVAGDGGFKFSGICAVGTSVYAAPYDSNQLLVYDTVSKQVSGVDVTQVSGSGCYKFSGICAIGTSIYAAPYNSHQILVYDTVSKKVSGVAVTGVAQGRHKFAGIDAIGTKVYAAPFRANQLLVYDTVSKHVSGVDVTGVVTDELKFSGVCGIGTSIYAAPHDSNQVLVYDTVSCQVSGVDVTGVATGKHNFSGICASGASLIAAPYNRDQLLVNFSSVVCRGMKVGGERVKTRNHAKHMPRDVAAKCGHHEVVKYFDALSPFIDMRGGSGDAYDEAMQDTRHATQIAWYTMPLRGTAGTFGAMHSCLAITVAGPDSPSHVYVLEKAATEEACEQWANGVFLSHWADVVHCIDGDPLHTLHAASMFRHLTMKDMREVAVGLGEYSVATCNCHHAAQSVYNACAKNEHRVTELPNAILVQSAGFLGSIGLDVTAWHSPASGSSDACDISFDSWLIDILRENGAHGISDTCDKQVFKLAQSVYEEYEASKEVQEKVIELTRELARISNRFSHVSSVSGEQQKCREYLQNAKDSLDQIRSSNRTVTPESAIARLSDTLRDAITLMASFATLAMPAPKHSEQSRSSSASGANAAFPASQHVESAIDERLKSTGNAAQPHDVAYGGVSVDGTDKSPETHQAPLRRPRTCQTSKFSGRPDRPSTGKTVAFDFDAQVSNNPVQAIPSQPGCCCVM